MQFGNFSNIDVLRDVRWQWLVSVQISMNSSVLPNHFKKRDTGDCLNYVFLYQTSHRKARYFQKNRKIVKNRKERKIKKKLNYQANYRVQEILAVWFYLHLYIFIYIYIYLFIFIYMYLYLYIFIYIYIYVFIFIYIYLYLYIWLSYILNQSDFSWRFLFHFPQENRWKGQKAF